MPNARNQDMAAAKPNKSLYSVLNSNMRKPSKIIKISQPWRNVHCRRHFVEAAKKWYDTVSSSVEAICLIPSTGRKLTAKKPNRKLPKAKAKVSKRPSSPPTRVQPRRAAKEKHNVDLEREAQYSFLDAEDGDDVSGPSGSGVDASDGKMNLTTTGFENLNVSDFAAWSQNLAALADAEIARLVPRFLAGEPECAYRSVPWTCGGCRTEFAADTSLGSCPVVDPVCNFAPVAPMDLSGSLCIRGRQNEVRDAMEIHTDQTVQLGGLRFVVDVCDGSDKYLIVDERTAPPS